MIITNIENYLTLTGLLVDAFNNETVDVYFNADDDGHWYSFILNRRLWY